MLESVHLGIVEMFCIGSNDGNVTVHRSKVAFDPDRCTEVLVRMYLPVRSPPTACAARARPLLG